MIIYSNRSMAECINILEENIVVKRRNFAIYTPNILYKDEMVGKVEGTKFWVEKTKARYVETVSRAFEGEICKEGDKTKISGRFKFSKLYYCIVLCLPIMVLLLMIQRDLQYVFAGGNISIQMLFGLIAPSFLLILFVSLSCLNVWIHRKDEQAVTDFLNRIFTNYGGIN